jgi:nucleotide-binding universal stress UspA family protein
MILKDNGWRVLPMAVNDLCTTAKMVRDRADVVDGLAFDLAWRRHVPPLVSGPGPVTVVVANHEPLPDELWTYAQELSSLLGGQLRRAMVTRESDTVRHDELGECDLVVLGKGSRSLLHRLLAGSGAEAAAVSEPGVPSRQDDASFAVLAAQNPCLPLARILLVLCGGSADQVAVNWTLRLACPSSAAVTVLAVVPSVQAMYHGLARMRQSLRAVLSSDTPLGRQMRETAQRLVDAEVSSALRLRQGPPEQEICREMAEGGYDLAIMATRPCRWWLRQLKGDPICSLLRWADRPMLFVEPTTE